MKQIRYVVLIILAMYAVSAMAQSAPVSINVHPELGPILTDADGFTAYTFELDTVDALACVDTCLDAWFPITVTTPDVEQIDASGTLATRYRDDLETYQLTWDESPLYTFSGDSQAGDINGHEVGNVWFAVPIDSSVSQSADQPISDDTTTSQPPGDVTNTPLTVINHPEYGNILADSEGYTVYTYGNDEIETSNCVGQCLVLWPPMIALSDDSMPSIAGFDFGVLSRDDQAIDQITVNGFPLYYYIEDEEPLQVTGHNVGEIWFVVNVDTIRVSDSYYTTANGMTLYRFANDEPNWSNCIGTCAETWVPYTVDEPDALLFVPDEDVELDLSLRADDTYQITLDGQPLYTYAGDVNAGDTNGADVDDNWSLVYSDTANSSLTCVITSVHNQTNIRSEPITSSTVLEKIEANESKTAISQTEDDYGYTWWELETGGFLREDVVTEDDRCTDLPVTE